MTAARRELKRKYRQDPLEPLQERPGGRHYVTVRDGSRTGYLLGPYASHMMSLMNRERGRRLAHERNSWAPFYSYGTSSSDRTIRTVFGR